MSDKKSKNSSKKASGASKGKKEASAKGSPIGSIKKMLGLGAGSTAKKADKKASKKETQKTSGKMTPKASKAEGKSDKALLSKVAQVKGAGKASSKEVTKTAGKTTAVAEKGKPSKASVQSSKKSAIETRLSLGDRRDSSGAPICREVACELIATTATYCRMHYIKNWKKIKRKEMILKEKKLNSYIEELISKYPDKYIEAIRQDLSSEKDFAKVIADLEIEEGLDDFESVETETAEGLIDSIKREFDDEGDVF